MNLVPEDIAAARKQKGIMKWDKRKNKYALRFVAPCHSSEYLSVRCSYVRTHGGVDDQTKKGRTIVTESGNRIKSSYSTNM